MNLFQAFKMALKSLSTSKMRSFLTMLGIIIGVASVIILVSIVNGVTTQVTDTFESLGANTLTLSISGRGGNRAVDVDDMIKLADDNPDVIVGVSPVVTVSSTVKYGDENILTTATGVNEEYEIIKDIEIAEGRGICYADVENRLHNCVVGTYITEELFGGIDYMGQSIKINGTDFKIVGVIEESADSEDGSADEVIYIPYTLAMKLNYVSNVSSFTFAAANNELTNEVEDIIDRFMYSIFGSTDYHNIINMADMLDTLNEITAMMSVMMAGIAGISLLVGGIGIMNIMLVSVTERTREIGVRKSLGATPWDIQSQFVVEAITTSALGGIIGVLLGILLSEACKVFTHTALSVPSMIIAFLFSVFIGVAFGYFPAKKAAKLNPIDALRYD